MTEKQECGIRNAERKKEDREAGIRNVEVEKWRVAIKKL